MSHSISVIIPTIGRPQSLERLLNSLARQTTRASEIIIADGSADGETLWLASDPRWRAAGLEIRRVAVQPPHAVRQREAAIAASSGDLLLMLDDDVELEPDCVKELLRALEARPDAVAAMADFSNQSWPMPTRAWRLYLHVVHGLTVADVQGRVVGPLLRFGYNPSPTDVAPIEWMSTCNTLVKRGAFKAAGGFSDFFLRRATTNEDVDLGLKLRGIGPILFCPKAKIAHFHSPDGRLSLRDVAEDDLYNRYRILTVTLGWRRRRAVSLVAVYWIVECTSNILGLAVRGKGLRPIRERICGGCRGLRRIVNQSR